MRNKRMVVLPIVAILALSIAGVAYSAWTDKVLIEGTVKMNSLTIAFDYEEPPLCQEYYWDPVAKDLVPGEYKDKDVGSCDARYDELVVDEHTNKQGYKKLYITINNAYPQYIVHTTFIINNTGTVPVYIYGYAIDGAKCDKDGNVIHKLLWHDPNEDWIGGLYEDVNDNEVFDDEDILVINLELVDQLPFQIDPCHKNKQEIDIDFKQEAEECHIYIIQVEILAVQWNKLTEVP